MWASENRAPEERKRTKLVCNIKKLLIELQEVEPKHIVANYKTFKVHVRSNRRLCLVANVPENEPPQWVDEGFEVEDAVTEAVNEFADELFL